jgi:cell pole-organizing protein PopZ
MAEAQHEPTMEEILASIRKIISEDGPEAGAAPEAAMEVTAAPAPPPPAQPVHDDVLELTQEVEVAAPAPEPEDLAFETVAPAPMAAPSQNSGQNAGNDIFSDHTRRAMEDAFDNIPEEPAQAAPAPVYHPAPMAPLDGSTVENVFERAVRESFEPVLQKYISDNSAAVIDRMKPLIREWMDEHFPALLEGAVRAEVERVVKARGKR